MIYNSFLDRLLPLAIPKAETNKTNPFSISSWNCLGCDKTLRNSFVIMVCTLLVLLQRRWWMAAFKYIELSKAKVNKNLRRIIGEGRKRRKKEHQRNEKERRIYKYKSLRSIFGENRWCKTKLGIVIGGPRKANKTMRYMRPVLLPQV